MSAGVASSRPPSGVPGGHELILDTRPPPRRLGHAEPFAILFAVLFLVARFAPVLELGLPCPFKLLTGHPCPTCGMTHAFVLLAHGQALEALRWSPLGAALAAGGWAFAVVAALRLLANRPWPALPARAPHTLARAVAVALVLNWAFVLAAGRA